MQLAGQRCRRLVASGSRIHATRRALASTGCQPVTQMCAVRCPEVSWAGGRGMSVLPAIIEHMNETNALNVTGDGPAGSPASPVPTTGSQGGAGPGGPQDPDAPLERLERLEERICELAANLADLLTRPARCDADHGANCVPALPAADRLRGRCLAGAGSPSRFIGGITLAGDPVLSPHRAYAAGRRYMR
jgi:hypothetical protein